MTTQGTTATADLTSPVFMIEHLAQLFGVRIDSAREYTYRTDFPPARDLGHRQFSPITEDTDLALFRPTTTVSGPNTCNGPQDGPEFLMFTIPTASQCN